jgi:hypothetical protein
MRRICMLLGYVAAEQRRNLRGVDEMVHRNIPVRCINSGPNLSNFKVRDVTARLMAVVAICNEFPSLISGTNPISRIDCRYGVGWNVYS